MTSLRESRYADDFGPFDGRIWFNTAHQGPLPRVSVQAARQTLEQKTRPHELRDDEFFETPRRLREVLGRLIAAKADDIVLGNSTSYGLDLLAHGIRWLSGDEVLLVKGDFPADIFPWFILRERGVRVRICEPRGPVITAETLAQEISPQTRLFCTTWINSFTGHLIDIDSLGGVCRSHGIIFVLNASQGLGARTLNVQCTPVDGVTCCGYKWLCGPYGTGFCWLTPSLRNSLAVQHAYWLPMQEGKPLNQMRDYTLREDLGAKAWDVFCTANFLNFRPWTAALTYVLEAHPERIAEYDQQLVDRFVKRVDRDRFELLSPENPQYRSTLIVIRSRDQDNCSYWHERLAGAGIDVAVREGNLRISPHLHNTIDEVDRLLQELSS